MPAGKPLIGIKNSVEKKLIDTIEQKMRGLISPVLFQLLDGRRQGGQNLPGLP